MLFGMNTIILKLSHSPDLIIFRFSCFKIGQSQPRVAYKSVADKRSVYFYRVLLNARTLLHKVHQVNSIPLTQLSSKMWNQIVLSCTAQILLHHSWYWEQSCMVSMWRWCWDVVPVSRRTRRMTWMRQWHFQDASVRRDTRVRLNRNRQWLGCSCFQWGS